MILVKQYDFHGETNDGQRHDNFTLVQDVRDRHLLRVFLSECAGQWGECDRCSG